MPRFHEDIIDKKIEETLNFLDRNKNEKARNNTMKKEMKLGNKYFIINIDEPYAKDIYEVLKAGQIAKGEWPEGDITFDEWVKQTWDEDEMEFFEYPKCPYCGELTFNQQQID